MALRELGSDPVRLEAPTGESVFDLLKENARPGRFASDRIRAASI